MRCKRTICAGCCTRLDGVNHCFRCLKEMGRRSAEPRVSAGAGVAMTVVLLAVGGFILFVECLLLVEGKLAP
jgi:hypothetical protein